MGKPVLLDLFCGAGGAAMGYHRAGFEVVGVDIKPQPRYPFRFIQADALEYCAAHGAEYDVIHASPPCQGYSVCKALHPDYEYPMLVESCRAALRATGRSYVIENVVGAPLECPITLCGTMFGLKVFRHRLFESNILLLQPPHSRHVDRIGQNGFCCVAGNGGDGRKKYYPKRRAEWSLAMGGLDWMTRRELREAIPPAYTEFIGKQLMHAVRP